MKKEEIGNDAVIYLAERAAIFFAYLDANVAELFPDRKAAWADLEERVQSGSKRRLKAMNDMIDNVIISSNGLSNEDRYNILQLFEEKLQENRNALIDKKRAIAHKIIANGYITSRDQGTDAIEIRNSEILNLTEEEKKKLSAIMQLPIVRR
jgi:hypothetical protein